MSSEPLELKSLRDLSGRLGCDPLLVQASSGNTSMKLDGVLWIKASGKWLADAEQDDFLVSLDLASICTDLRYNSIGPAGQSSPPKGRRASIETPMHAVLPNRVVVHVHSVNTISWAVRDDAPARLATRLDGLFWKWIPYTSSGISLARRIEEALAFSPGTNVFVLGNHGLVVTANTCEEAEQLLRDVERRLMVEPRPVPEPNWSELAQSLPGPSWSLPALAGIHALANDCISRRILSRGVLYPCQAIFLPGSTPALRPRFRKRDECANGQGVRQPFLIVEDTGVFVKEDITRAEGEMLNGLAQIVQRLDSAASIRYLSSAEIANVLNNEADNYRQMAERSCYRPAARSSFKLHDAGLHVNAVAKTPDNCRSPR